jgi:hypothetical protein
MTPKPLTPPIIADLLQETSNMAFVSPEKFSQRPPKVVVWNESEPPSFDLLHDGHRYEIECSRCDTPRKLVEWIQHLNGKAWFTRQHLNQLIIRVMMYNPAPFDPHQ